MRERQTARVILLDDVNRVLLFEINAEPPQPSRWIGPGGGIEPGESAIDAAHRELVEETGLRGLALSEQIATFAYDIVLPDGESLHVVHNVFVARMGDQQIDHTGMNDEERSLVTGYRWWSLDELRAEQPDVRPPGFVELVERIIAGRALH